jgi:DNA-binding PadR family transcriptional regulator
MKRQGRLYAQFADSQWYAEPKRLARLGYLSARTEPGRTRQRTHYDLTDAGREALRRWVREPAPFSRIQAEPAWRVMAADLVGEEAVLASLAGLRAEIREIGDRLADAEASAAGLPHREKYLRLNLGLARRLLAAHEEWLDEVEASLGGQSARSDPAGPPERA